jgi:transcriptional regulator with XRE-family HTH domain
MELVTDFAHRLDEAMRQRHIRAYELSRISGISKSNISNYLSGHYKPNRERTTKLANALQVNEMWIIGYDCKMERFELTHDEKKDELLRAINSMSDEQIKKTLIFVREFIIKNETN